MWTLVFGVFVVLALPLSPLDVRVRDSLGGAIPGATVRIVNETSGAPVEAVSDAQGSYRIELPPGRYRVEVTLDGFETAVQRVTLQPGPAAIDVTLLPSRITESVVVTARRVEEVAQEVPIPVSVVSGSQLDATGAFNVNRLKELVPTVQFYSTNPRNSAINIRGLGAPFGLTNDGLEPGVGLYIDGVFYARPASASLDFLDVEQIEVLRGPQGTLFGKNTTAGAINVTTRKPSFTRASDFELNVGDLGFLQAKASFTSPLGGKVAGRLSFSGTQRNGSVFNTRTGQHVNDLDNAGVRGQVLNAPTDKASASTQYRSTSGTWGIDARLRHTNAYPVNSGVFATDVDFPLPGAVGTYRYDDITAATIFDLGFNVRFQPAGNAVMLSVRADNLFDTKYRTMPGLPEIGMMLVTRLQYSF